MRPLFMRTGTLSRADGSAYYESGDTKVIAAVYGPRPLPAHEEYAERAALDVEFRRASFATVWSPLPEVEGASDAFSSASASSAAAAASSSSASALQDGGGGALGGGAQLPSASRGKATLSDQEREYSAFIARALECAVMRARYPKTQISVYVMVLEDDGSSLSAAVTAASLACADAAIEMRDLVPAVTVVAAAAAAAAMEDGRVVTDPRLAEELDGERRLVAAYLPSRAHIANMVLTGGGGGGGSLVDTNIESFERMLNECVASCGAVADAMRSCLVQRAEKLGGRASSKQLAK